MKFTKNTSLFFWLLVLAIPLRINAMRARTSSRSEGSSRLCPPPPYEEPPAYNALFSDKAMLSSLFQWGLFKNLSRIDSESAQSIATCAFEGRTDDVEKKLEKVNSSDYTVLALIAAARGCQTDTFETIYHDYLSRSVDTHLLIEDLREHASIDFVRYLCKSRKMSGEEFFWLAREKHNIERMSKLVEEGLYEPNICDVVEEIRRARGDEVSDYLDILVQHKALTRSGEICEIGEGYYLRVVSLNNLERFFGSEDLLPPLVVAVRSRKANIVQYLLKNKAPIYDSSSSVKVTKCETSPEITRMLNQEVERMEAERRQDELSYARYARFMEAIAEREAERIKESCCVIS